MGIVIDGKNLAQKILEDLRKQVDYLRIKGIVPTLAVIMVGNNTSSKVYIKNKSNACEKIGVKFEEYYFEKNIENATLIKLIKKLNARKDVNGILIQSPISEHLDMNELANCIDYKKDVDGLNCINIGKLSIGEECFIPCTALGVMKIFEEYKIPIKRKHVVIVGRSNLVGKPLIQCLLNQDATVTICHSKTENLEQITQRADILISATGKENLITENMIKKNAIVIDVGITRNNQNQIVGDVEFEKVKQQAEYITPVPGGVGPMTIAMLLSNVIKATKKQNKLV